jgi:dinuclear metal center YbgI/SA1388 family protein
LLFFEILMTIEDFVAKLEKILPFEAGLENDKLGLQIKTDSGEISNALICYELTPEVIEEALSYKSNLIISFHPLIYHPLQNILNTERVGTLVQGLIRNGISLVVCHTNFDAYQKGTSWIFANRIGLVVTGFLLENKYLQGFGFGVVGEFPSPITELDFLSRISKITYSPLRWCKGKSDFVSKVAVVAGSGFSFAELAYEKEVDAFVTADISYHNFHKYNGKMILVDPGHWEMEYFVAKALKELFEEFFNGEVSFFVSNIYTNPVRYFAEKNYNLIQENNLLNISGK